LQLKDAYLVSGCQVPAAAASQGWFFRKPKWIASP